MHGVRLLLPSCAVQYQYVPFGYLVAEGDMPEEEWSLYRVSKTVCQRRLNPRVAYIRGWYSDLFDSLGIEFGDSFYICSWISKYAKLAIMECLDDTSAVDVRLSIL